MIGEVKNSAAVKEFFESIEGHLDRLQDLKSDIEVEDLAAIRSGLNGKLVIQDIYNYGDVLTEMLSDLLKLKREL